MARTRTPIGFRLWGKTYRDEYGCLIWEGNLDPGGYGQIRIERKMKLTHRVAWELLRGPIPDGLQIDHLCRNRACCNPEHLDVVTQKENILRGESPSAIHARQTHCKRGHEFTPENTYIRLRGGRQERHCRECKRLSDKGRIEKRRQYRARKRRQT